MNNVSRNQLIYNFNRVALPSLLLWNIANIIQLLQNPNTSKYRLIFVHAVVWILIPILIEVFGKKIYEEFSKTKENIIMSGLIMILITIVFLFTYSRWLWEIVKL